jgi:hypothetical protein
MSMSMVRELVTWPLSGGVALYSWQAGCVVTVMSLGIHLLRFAAGCRRDRIVVDLACQAPAGTMVEIGPADWSAVRVWIGGEAGT